MHSKFTVIQDRKTTVLLLLGFLLSSATSEEVSAWNPITAIKKSVAKVGKTQDAKTLVDIASGFQGVSKDAASVAADLSKFTNTKRFEFSSDEMAPLMALGIFLKNTSEFFNWLYVVSNDLKTDYNTAKKSNDEKNKENASEKSVDKAQTKFDVAQGKVTKEALILLGNGMNVVFANCKTSANIYLQLIRALEFSEANLVTLKKRTTALKAKCDKAKDRSTQLGTILDNIKNTAEIDSIDDDDVKKLIKNIKLLSEIISYIQIYYNSGEKDDATINRLVNKCSNVGDEDDEDDEVAPNDNTGEQKEGE